MRGDPASFFWVPELSLGIPLGMFVKEQFPCCRMARYPQLAYMPLRPHPMQRHASCLLAAAALFCASALLAANNPPPAGAADQVGPLVLRQDSLEQGLNLLELLTGKTVLRGPGLPSTPLTLELAEPLPRVQAINAVEALLSLHGVAIVPMGERFLKALPLGAARTEVGSFIEGSTLGLPASGQIASKLFFLQFLRAQEFSQQAAALINGAIPPVVFEKANAVLVTDTIATLQRIEAICDRLDRIDTIAAKPRYFSLRNAKAGELAGRLTAMITSPPLNTLIAPTAVLADDRTNQIVVGLDDRAYPIFLELVNRLDDKTESYLQNEVIALKNASAKDVAALLGQLSGKRLSATVTTPGLPPHAPAAAKPAEGAPPPVVTSTAITSDAVSANFSELLSVVPDERSNALVVIGTPQDLRLIRDLVAKIDVLLAQVRIEVVIAEVTLSDAASTGISELGLKIEGSKLVGFSTAGPGFGVSNATLTRDTSGNVDLAATITAGTTPRKGNTRILSVPNILTTHNKEASIFVGEARPVISSYLQDTASAGLGSGYRTSVSASEIGIELKVQPLIGHDGTVQLTIEQEVNDVTGSVLIDGNEQPVIGKRRTASFISVRDGEIIVLGGLQRAQNSRSTSRLGPVPIIGDLLGSRRREQTRTDLVFFLRPTIIANTGDASAQATIERNLQQEDIRRALGQPPATPKR